MLRHQIMTRISYMNISYMTHMTHMNMSSRLYTTTKKTPPQETLQTQLQTQETLKTLEQQEPKLQTQEQEPKLQTQQQMIIQFKCKICSTTNCKKMSKLSYEKGVVIIKCDSCKSLHLIAGKYYRFSGSLVSD